MLPKWLPEDIVHKMVDIFQSKLIHELSLLEQPPSRPMHRPKQESASNLSVTSSEGKGENFEIDLDELNMLAHPQG